MIDIESYDWSDWRSFPNPLKKGILVSPFGPGLYQLRNTQTDEFVLFGIGGHLSYRMTSLLPEPQGQGNRKNMAKRVYVYKNIQDIEYRTIACRTENDAKTIEKKLKALNNHIFNT